eukprot:m.153404 g.153404  ORF g.153404 m.153404 type:complete len:62 (+) comp24587_c1_seq2:59-244(+)
MSVSSSLERPIKALKSGQKKDVVEPLLLDLCTPVPGTGQAAINAGATIITSTIKCMLEKVG